MSHTHQRILARNNRRRYPHPAMRTAPPSETFAAAQPVDTQTRSKLSIDNCAYCHAQPHKHMPAHDAMEMPCQMFSLATASDKYKNADHQQIHTKYVSV